MKTLIEKITRAFCVLFSRKKTSARKGKSDIDLDLMSKDELMHAAKQGNIRLRSDDDIRRAAEQGDPVACHFLAAGAHDKTEAIKWYRHPAELGNAQGQYFLAMIYGDCKNGDDRIAPEVPQDTAEAVKWYRRAAEQGHVEAQFFLATMYDFGGDHDPLRGRFPIPQDKAEAVKWYRLAAEQGHPLAQDFLSTKILAP